jgi:hypothetical protein
LRSIWYLPDLGLIRISHNQFGLLLFILSLALVAIRVRRPRPPRIRLWCQPGFTACAAACVGVAVNALNQALATHCSLRDWEYYTLAAFWSSWPYAGPAVAGAWLGLSVARRWRAERSSIELLGCLVGVCWLVEAVLGEMPGTRWCVILGRTIQGR